MDPITLLAALGPLFGKLGSAAIDRWIRPDSFKPATIDDVEKMTRLEIERFKALNEAGGGTPSYPWVAAIIQLQRPSIVVAVLAMALWQVVTLGNVSEFVQNALGVVGSYLFMDRTLFHLSGKK